MASAPPTWSLPWLPWVRAREPRRAPVGAEPEPAGRARAAHLRHRDARRLRARGPRRRPGATGWRSSTSSPTTRASSSTPSTRPAAGPTPWSSTPARSATPRGRCTTPWPPSRGPSSSCTSPTPPPASRSGTPRCSPRSPSGVIAGFGGLGYELAVDAVAALLAGRREGQDCDDHRPPRANPYTPATLALPPITVTGRLDRLRAAFDEHESTRWS